MTSDRATTADHVSAFDLDLLELGQLGEAKRKIVDEHLQTCLACQEEQQALRKARADFTAKVMPRTVGKVRDRIRAASAPVYARPVFWAPAFASAAALALWVAIGRPGLQGTASEGEIIQAKGTA